VISCLFSSAYPVIAATFLITVSSSISKTTHVICTVFISNLPVLLSNGFNSVSFSLSVSMQAFPHITF